MQVKQLVVKAGFTPQQADDALRAAGASLQSCLSYLCLTLPEHVLPRSFVPKMGTQVELVQVGGGRRVAAAADDDIDADALAAATGESFLERQRQCLSFVAAALCPMLPSPPPSTDLPEAVILLLKSHRDALAAACANPPSHDTAAADVREAIDGEIIALDSILGPTCFTPPSPACPHTLRILTSVPRIGNLTVILDTAPHFLYPHHPPLISIACSKLKQHERAFLAVKAMDHCMSLLGQCMAYDVSEWVKEHALQLLEECAAVVSHAAAPSASSCDPSTGTSAAAAAAAADADSASDSGDTYATCSSFSTAATARRSQRDFNSVEPIVSAISKRAASRATFEAVRRSLPVHAFRQQILDAIASNQVVLLVGETGCGKTTQLPQYILEAAAATNSACFVHVCQPRRLSAVGVAERVSQELCDSVGNLVGYSIRLETRRSASTRLLFSTTGIMLRRLQSDPALQGVTHVVVDEVHERSLDSDFLLILLRRLLSKRKDLKVILMSATVNAELFSSYFNSCPYITVPGRTFPVVDHHLDYLLQRTQSATPFPLCNIVTL